MFEPPTVRDILLPGLPWGCSFAIRTCRAVRLSIPEHKDNMMGLEATVGYLRKLTLAMLGDLAELQYKR